MDSEGEPVQEMSAICIKTETLQIISAFHRYARCPQPDGDIYSRLYIHGLNVDYLNRHGLPSSCELVTEFCRWIDKLPRWEKYYFFANNPTMERKLIPYLTIDDICLTQWTKRIHTKAHKMAKAAKDNSAFVLDCYCPADAHNMYKNTSSSRRPECSLTPSQLAKLSSGYHCSLYEVLECYFTYCHRALGNKNDELYYKCIFTFFSLNIFDNQVLLWGKWGENIYELVMLRYQSRINESVKCRFNSLGNKTSFIEGWCRRLRM